MLVLSRKKNESIVINNDITIVVVEIRGDKVRLAIDVPNGVSVHRKEVYDAIHRQDAPAPGPPTNPLEPPQPHFSQRQPDRLERFAAALQAKLAVPVDLDLVVQAMREAGIEDLAMKMMPE